MSFSWKDKINITKNKFKTPSPTLFQIIFYQNSREIKRTLPMKRISPTTCTEKIKGSMTIEATLLLPLLLFFFLQLTGIMEMMRLHGKLTLALWECGNTLTVYAAMQEELSEKIPDLAISHVYVKNRVENFLGKEYLDSSPVVSGRSGINYLAADYTDDCIDIGITYQVSPPISTFPMQYVRLANRYYGKCWTGYEINPEITYVYITLYGEVWHEKIDCSHIYITVQEADSGQIKKLRNRQKEKYSLCQLCKDKGGGETVYYTDQGNRYHKDKECSALVRYVRAVILEEEMAYPPCSRCVGKGN